MLAILNDWFGTFWKIMIAPTPQTFLDEAKKADGKFASAIAWMVFCAAYVFVLTSVFVGQAPLIVLAAAVILAPLAVVLFTSAMYYTYRRLAHRKEYVYDKLLYITVSILLPLPFIFLHGAVFLPAALDAVVFYLLLAYQIVLLTVALKTIADIEYWQALFSIFVAILVAGAVSGVVLILLYGAMQPPVLAQ